MARGLDITVEGLAKAAEFIEKVSIIGGSASILFNGYRYSQGSISGDEFWTNTAITGTEMAASLIFGPEAAMLIEGSVLGAKYMAKAEEANPELRDFTNQFGTGPWFQ